MSLNTVCSSVERLPFVFASKTESRSMISFAWGRLTGMAGCWGSSCSPISISEELPSEITKDENVTGMPLPDSTLGSGEERAASLEELEGGAGWSEPAPLPRRSRTTNPSSLSPAMAYLHPIFAGAYHRPYVHATR